MNRICSTITVAVPFKDIMSFEEYFSAEHEYMKSEGFTANSDEFVFADAFQRACEEATTNELTSDSSYGGCVMTQVKECLKWLFRGNEYENSGELARNFGDEPAAVGGDLERYGFLLEVTSRLCDVGGDRSYIPSVKVSRFHFNDNGDIVKGDTLFTGTAEEITPNWNSESSASEQEMPVVNFKIRYDFGKELGTIEFSAKTYRIVFREDRP